MKIGLDVSPLENTSMLTHRVRGTGFYIENLKKSLLKYFPQNEYVFFTRGELLEENVNIAHYPYFEPFFLTLPLRKSHKTVVTVHDLTPFVFPEHFPVGLRGKLKWWIQKMSLGRADTVITDSQSSKNDIMRFANIPESRIAVVYLAAGEQFKRIKNPFGQSSGRGQKSKINSIKTKYGLPEKFALYVGDATWNKNLPRLIEATKKADIPLVMVGKALLDTDFNKTNIWNKDLIKTQEMVKESKLVIRLGYVPTEDLVLLYNMANVFCMPSLYEGFGLPILEAMQCGCPVVTTKEGSLKEIAGDAAFFVDAYNIESIASGIEQIIEDKRLQRELSEKGLIQAKKFSWEETARKTMQVYKKIYEKTH